jgi:hypothetical protein
MPFGAWLISGRAQYVRDYRATVRQCLRMLRGMARMRIVARNIERVMQRDRTEYSVEGACTHCGRCCIEHTCVFLDMSATGQSSCAVYGSRFFRYGLTCGEYPLNAEDLAIYKCPSLRATPLKSRVIAIVPVR